MEDSKIIELYINRDEEAIRHTSDKYGKNITHIAYNILHNEQEALECENDTYLRLWNSIPPHEPWDYLFAFITKITRNISLDVCRKKISDKRNATLVELTTEIEQCIPSNDNVWDKIDEKIMAQKIDTFLYGLKEEQRLIFLRRYWYMDSVKEISNKFGISQSKVKTSLFRTRNQLMKYLKEEIYFEWR